MLKVKLDIGEIEIRVSDSDEHEKVTYLVHLLQSNNLRGSSYHDDINGETVVKGYGTNGDIYYALTEIQDETLNDYFTIE